MAEKVQSLWVSGDKPSAIPAVADEFGLAAMFVGTGSMVAKRVTDTAAAGINTLRLAPAGKTAEDQIENLERTVATIRSVSAVS
jgi:hypothetical protein